jgi:hypothetical protein
MRFLQLTGTAESPLLDDRTTAWMLSMVWRASETDALGRGGSAGVAIWSRKARTW